MEGKDCYVGGIYKAATRWRGKTKTETSYFSTPVFNNILYYNKLCYVILYILYNHYHSYMIISAGMERRQSTAQHQGTTKNMTPQDTIRTITELVEGSAGDSATK
jgi:hypothetical protein